MFQEYAVQNLLLYYDSEYQWPSVYKTSKVRPGFLSNLLLIVRHAEPQNLSHITPKTGQVCNPV